MVSLALPQSALQNWLQPERSGQLARLVNVLLVIWLAWLLASLSWLVLPEPESGPVQIPVVVTAPAQRKQSHIDERQIAEWHIFGIAGEEAVEPAVVVNAPETRLKLTLRGLFASDKSSDGRAIIGDPKGKEESYAVGDPVPGGAKLSEIHKDRVILERNGRYETLRLPRERSGNTGGRSVKNAGAGRSGTSNPGQAAAFTRYRSEIKQNPAAFLKYVRATPARKDGKFIGFRLQAGKERGALKELGLKPGDIVTAINGVQIDSPAKGMKAMQALGEGESVDVILQRGGQEVSMNLALPSAK